MRNLYDRVSLAAVRRPWLLATIIVVITVSAIVGYTDPTLVDRLWRGNPEEQSSTADQPEDSVPKVTPVNLTHADAILVVQGDNFFTPRAAAALRDVVESLEELPYVQQILWMDRVPILNIFGLPEPLFPRPQASAHRFAAAKEKALAHPLVRGQLLSDDAKTLLMLIRFDWLYVRSDRDCDQRLRELAEQTAARHPDVKLSFQVAGEIPMYLAIRQSHDANNLRYQIIGYAVIGLMAIILFRGLAAVLVVALAPSLGVFWTLGIIRFFHFQENPFHDVVLPIMLSLIGLTDGVHLMIQIRGFRAAGMSGRDAALAGVRAVGMACMLTSLTTAIGFGSLSFAHHFVVREFGRCCVIGVILTYIAVVTFVPLACSSWLGRRIHIGHGRGWIDQHLGKIGGMIDWILPRSRFVSAAGIAITGVLVLMSLQLEPNERNWSGVPGRSEPARAMAHMDRAFGGLEFAQVDVNWSTAIPDGDPTILKETIEILVQLATLRRIL